MKEAMHYEKLKDKKVHCHLCPHNCVILPDSYGFCRARKNLKGTLYSMVYGRPVSTAIDPVEKKPLFHFMPGTDTLSLGTAGCNFRCLHCQNWEISQSTPEEIAAKGIRPEKIVEMAIKNKCPSIAFTYNEPTIAFEYYLEIAKLAQDKDLKTVMFTNGYINKEPLEEIYQYINAANVDLKGFNEEFYRKECSAKLQPVLDSIKRMREMGIWVELTTLLIPTLNDDMKEVQDMCEWIKKNIGVYVPLHFSRFFPLYKQQNLPPTSSESLFKARETALKAGLKYAYIGNLHVEKEENTYCPKCKKMLVGRSGFGVIINNIRHGKCISCEAEIAGVWE